jgi:hypothetical protein
VSVFDDSYVWDNEADQGVYVMADSLNDDAREYVGHASDPTWRTRNHASCTGNTEAAAGFQYRRPLLTMVHETTGKKREKEETLRRMHVRGYGKVRGAQFVGAPGTSLRAAFEANCHEYDLCYKCGREGHYTSNLPGTVRCPNERINVDAIASAYWYPRSRA